MLRSSPEDRSPPRARIARDRRRRPAAFRRRWVGRRLQGIARGGTGSLQVRVVKADLPDTADCPLHVLRGEVPSATVGPIVWLASGLRLRIHLRTILIGRRRPTCSLAQGGLDDAKLARAVRSDRRNCASKPPAE